MFVDCFVFCGAVGVGCFVCCLVWGLVVVVLVFVSLFLIVGVTVGLGVEFGVICLLCWWLWFDLVFLSLLLWVIAIVLGVWFVVLGGLVLVCLLVGGVSLMWFVGVLFSFVLDTLLHGVGLWWLWWLICFLILLMGLFVVVCCGWVCVLFGGCFISLVD